MFQNISFFPKQIENTILFHDKILWVVEILNTKVSN